MGQTVISRTLGRRTIARTAGYLLAAVAAACGLYRWARRPQDPKPTPETAAASEGHRWHPGWNQDQRNGQEGLQPSQEPPYRFFGAKTSYRQVREASSAREITVPGCEPKQFWLLARHGARYPGPWEMSALLNRLPLLRDALVQNARNGAGTLNQQQLQLFEGWNMELRAGQDNRLTPEGQNEVRELAERFKHRFPSLLGNAFTVDDYHFRHTDSQRTADSARLFAKGLFGSADVCIPSPVKDDPVIKFYKTCRKWIEEVNDNVESRVERRRFRKGPEMRRVIEAVSERLGFKKKLSFDDLHLMFTMCRFESASQPERTSPWCNVFTRDEVAVIEYDEDLEYYWTDGYGFPINYEQACPPVKDFLDHFRAAMKEDSRVPLGVFRFTHSGLLLKVYARLGLFRDAVPPRADNFQAQMDRKWRSSFIDPFTANLALVLFRCNGSGSNPGHDYKLMAFVQEHPVALPGCDDLLCPMETVLRTYAQMADACDVATICCSKRRHGDEMEEEDDYCPPTSAVKKLQKEAQKKLLSS